MVMRLVSGWERLKVTVNALSVEAFKLFESFRTDMLTLMPSVTVIVLFL